MYSSSIKIWIFIMYVLSGGARSRSAKNTLSVGIIINTGYLWSPPDGYVKPLVFQGIFL